MLKPGKGKLPAWLVSVECGFELERGCSMCPGPLFIHSFTHSLKWQIGCFLCAVDYIFSFAFTGKESVRRQR